MSKIIITKGDDGKLRGVDDKEERSYAKFRRMVAGLDHGDTLAFSYRLPRSPKHHRLFFARLRSLLERTEAFDDLGKLRAWLLMGAGFAEFVPGFDGQPNAIPRSMDFEELDEAEFSEVHRAANDFLWTARAQETLWPALDDEARYRCMQSFMEAFE